MIKHIFAVSCVSLSMFAGRVSAQTTIEKVAPENTIIIAGVKNVASTLERLKRTSLWAAWTDEKLKKTREDEVKKFTEQMN